MLFLCLGEYHDAVNINKPEIPFKTTQDLLHQLLKGSTGVAQTKRHNLELKNTQMSNHGCFVSAVFTHGHLPITTL